MADRTRPRGARNTTAPGPHAGADAGVPPFVRAASRRALVIALTVAALIHAPFVPSRLFAFLHLWLHAGTGEVADFEEGETLIPIDLDLMADTPSAAGDVAPAAPAEPAPGEPPAEPAAASKPAPPPKPAPVAVLDAGVDAAPEDDAGAEPDAGAPVAAADVYDDVGDAGADAGEKVAEAPPLRDPLAAAGAPGNLAKDPNVQVLIAGDRLRKHALGAWFGTILVTIPEWNSFFKDTPINPIEDLDHLLIAGPQFRDSRKVVAVMDYRSEEKIRKALDGLVQRTKGEWLEGTPVPAARATADGGDRIFAMVTQKRLLVVLPAEEKEQLSKLKALKAFNKSSSAGIVISMLAPARAFQKVYKLPSTLKWMKLAVAPTGDAGADVTLAFGDASAADATSHAQELTTTLNAIRTLDLGITKVDVLDEVRFVADGDTIWAKVHVKEKQLKLIMGFVEQALKDQLEARKKKQKN